MPRQQRFPLFYSHRRQVKGASAEVFFIQRIDGRSKESLDKERSLARESSLENTKKKEKYPPQLAFTWPLKGPLEGPPQRPSLSLLVPRSDQSPTFTSANTSAPIPGLYRRPGVAEYRGTHLPSLKGEQRQQRG